jgi:uncharacterized protein YcfJ
LTGRQHPSQARKFNTPGKELEVVMNKKILAGFAALVLGAASLGAQAGGRHDRDDDRRGDRGNRNGQARVVHVEPIHERVRFSVPVEHCWNERVRRDGRDDRTGAAIAGGAVGAVIGNRLGDGRDLATVVGAIAGAAIGSNLARDGDRRQSRYGEVQRCEVRYEERFERRVVAYRVTYELRGRRDVTRLAYEPGRYLSIGDIRRRG